MNTNSSGYIESVLPLGYYRLKRQLATVTLTPGRFTLIYLVFGFSALYWSDVVLVGRFSDPLLSRLQAVKGGLEVVVTGGLIFFLSRHSRRQLKAKNDQLERTRDELQLLHRLFRHNLRNDINIIRGYIDLAQAEVTSDAGDRYCTQIKETTRKILQYTDQAQRIRRVSEHDTPATFALSDLLPYVLDHHDQIDDSVVVETTIPEDVVVETNPLIDVAIQEILSNSIEHNDSTPIRIWIEADKPERNTGSTTIRIRDNGPGIPEMEAKSLTEAGDSQILHSTGMGLWFVRWVITHSGGTTEISDNSKSGSEITIHLPTVRSNPLTFWAL